MNPAQPVPSYYGRPIVKPSPWQADIPLYLFTGGLAAGSSLLGAGADITGRGALRRHGRLAALGALGVSVGALVHDLGRPARFLNMLRTLKPTSPMSLGTWALSAYGALVTVAAAGELGPVRRSARRPLRLAATAARPGGLGAAAIAPTIAAYTAVLLADTATPTWHAAHRELPFLFVASAAAASGGLAIAACPAAESAPARRLAVGGVAVELFTDRRLRRSAGIAGEPLEQGRAGVLLRAARALGVLGGVGSLLGRRHRGVTIASGAALVASSACMRFGVFEAGQQSARDPRYTVVSQLGTR